MHKNIHDIQTGLQQVTVRSAEMLSRDDAKEHLRVTHTNDDTYIDSLVKAARGLIESYCNRAFVQKEYNMFLDRFPQKTFSADNHIYIKRSPIVSVESIKYYDGDNVQQTLSASNYIVDGVGLPSRITPASGLSWPSTLAKENAVEINFYAGLSGSGTAPNIDISANVPDEVLHANKLLVSYFYHERAPVSIGRQPFELPFSVQALLNSHVVEG